MKRSGATMMPACLAGMFGRQRKRTRSPADRAATGFSRQCRRAASVSLSACQWTSPITTQLQYDAADGKSTEVGKVKVLNALIVADKQDGPGTLVASFANQGSDKATIQVRVGQQVAGSVVVPAGAVVQASTGE